MLDFPAHLMTTIDQIEEVDTYNFISLMLARQERVRAAWSDLKQMVRDNTANLPALDSDQQKVVDLPADRKLTATIIANAGTGKSYTVLRRVLRICMEDERYCPADFTLVAFNNKAARQLHDKWFEITGLVDVDDAPAPRCTTLHALGYLTSISLRGKHGIMSERDKYKFVRDFLNRKESEDNPKAYCDALEQIALSGVLLKHTDPDTIIDVGIRSVSDSARIEPLYLLELRAKYEAHKQKTNVLDFEDLALVGGMLARDTGQINRDMLKTLHKFIIVDEGQDIDPTQYHLVSNLTDSLIIIGDIKQTLYAWRQADPSLMLNHSMRKLYLTHNYRSDERIVKFVNRAHKLFPYRNPPSIPTKGLLSGDKAITIAQAKNPEHEINIIVEKIANILRAGEDPNEIAVLTHTNNQCKSFEAACFAARIPYRIKQHRTTIAESAEFLTLSALARLEKNPSDHEAMLILAENTNGIGKKTLEQLSLGPDVTIKNSKIQGVLSRHKNMAERIAEGTPQGYEEKIAFWAHTLQTNTDLNIDLDKLSASVDLMFEVVRRPSDPDLALLSDNPLDIIAMNAPDVAKGDSPKITLSTVHATKGLEYGNVYLPYMNHNPHMPPPRHPQEQACHLYVAISRAKKTLNISFSLERNLSQPTFSNGRPMKPMSMDVNYELVKLLAD